MTARRALITGISGQDGHYLAHFLEGRDEELARRLTKEMEEAAAELKFERATVLRDQIQSLNKVRERQKIISTDDVDQDVIGVVRQGSDACVELFFVRKGRLVGQEPFFFDKVAGWSDGEILSAFVRQFYGKSVTPAPELLLSEELPEADLVLQALHLGHVAVVRLVLLDGELDRVDKGDNVPRRRDVGGRIGGDGLDENQGRQEQRREESQKFAEERIHRFYSTQVRGRRCAAILCDRPTAADFARVPPWPGQTPVAT